MSGRGVVPSAISVDCRIQSIDEESRYRMITTLQTVSAHLVNGCSKEVSHRRALQTVNLEMLSMGSNPRSRRQDGEHDDQGRKARISKNSCLTRTRLHVDVCIESKRCRERS